MSTQATISTHVLDTALGKPAAGVGVTLEVLDEIGGGKALSQNVTNADGRVGALLPEGHVMQVGMYRLTFDVASYFAATKRSAFYRSIRIEFEVSEAQHYHVPLLLSPFGYSTYRGS